MERETKKRGREGEDRIDCFAMKTAKMAKQENNHQHCYESDHHHHQEDTRKEESDESHISSDHYGHDEGKHVGLGVFDFPWLHDDGGVISKSDEEYWNFQDIFTCPPEAVVEYNRQCLYETPTTTTTTTTKPSMNNQLEEINVWPLESVDCIWSWMLNQQLQQDA